MPFLILCSLTLYFNPVMQDPFNSAKQIVLFLISSWCLGSLITNFVPLKRLTIKSPIILFASIFALSNLSGALFTSPGYVGFFGETLRKNGALTYASLFLIFLVLVTRNQKSDEKSVINAIFFCSLFIGVYGFIQSQGIDFVRWNNPYNSIIVTMGNPNFASAIMAILGVATLVLAFDKKQNILLRIANFILTILLLTNIINSQSRQGLLAFIFGAAVGIFFLIRRSFGNKIAAIWITFILVFGVLVIIGMFQKGPLSPLVYKDSVSIRGFYWRAAIRMFLDHPITGIGIDSYGDYFKFYREPTYVLRYGFNITSNNAHSVILQFFATLGIVGGLAYLIFVSLVFYKVSQKLIRIDTSNNNSYYIAIFSAWVSYQAQAVISIDQIGLAIWNWCLSGLLVAWLLNVNSETKVNSTQQVRTSFQTTRSLLVSSIVLILCFIPCIILYQNEVKMSKLRSMSSSLNTDPSNSQFRSAVNIEAEQIKNRFLIDPYYIFLASTYQSDQKLSENGINSIQKLLKSDPKNLDYLGALAFYASRDADPMKVIRYRTEIYKLDPYNAQNLLDLGRAYKFTGAKVEQIKIFKIIQSFAKDTDIYKQAVLEISE